MGVFCRSGFCMEGRQMRMLKREELILLREVLLNVQKMIQRTEKQQASYYYVQFDNMINNIGIYLLSDDVDLFRISEVLLRDWLNANHELLGLSTCELFCGIQNEGMEETYRFWELIATVENYFPEEGEDGVLD